MCCQKLTSAVEGHAASSDHVMLLKTSLLNELLGCDVAGGEENSSGDALGQQRASGKFGAVPRIGVSNDERDTTLTMEKLWRTNGKTW